MNSLIQRIRKINARFVNMTSPQLEDALGLFLFVIVSINGIAAILAVLIYYYVYR